MYLSVCALFSNEQIILSQYNVFKYILILLCVSKLARQRIKQKCMHESLKEYIIVHRIIITIAFRFLYTVYAMILINVFCSMCVCVPRSRARVCMRCFSGIQLWRLTYRGRGVGVPYSFL